MAILRVQKRKEYGLILNSVTNDERLSYRALGIYAYLITKPDDWQIIISNIYRKAGEESGREGKKAVYAAMKELADLGYITKESLKESGRFAGIDYTLHETPCTQKGDTETPPHTLLPDTLLSDTVNGPLQITNKQITDLTNSTNDVVAIVNVSSGDENFQDNNNNKDFDLSFLDRKQLVFKPAVLQVLDEYPEGMWWEATVYTWNGNAPGGFMSSFLELKKKHGWEKYAAGIVIAKGSNQHKRPTLRFLETILDKMTINATASPSNVYRMPNASTTSEPVDDDYHFSEEDLRKIEENKQAILAMRAAQ